MTRPTLRHLALALAMLLPAVVAATPDEARLALDIRPAPLLHCLEQLAARAHVPIVDRSGRVATAQCEAVRGRLTLEQALDALLTPAQLTWRRHDDAIEIILWRDERIDLAPLAVEDTPLPALEPVTAQTPPVTALAHAAMSTTRVEQEQLASAPLLSFNQIGRYAPNVYGSGLGLAIRGLERDQDTFSALSVHLDGIELGSSLIEGDLIAVDGLSLVEIERGPRSFERAGVAAAGGLNLYTEAPSTQPTTRVALGAGDHDTWRGSASWSGRFGDSESGARVALEHRQLADTVQEVYLPASNHAHRRIDNGQAKITWVPEGIAGLSVDIASLAVSGDDVHLWTPRHRVFPLTDSNASYATQTQDTHTRAIGGAARIQYGGDNGYLRLTTNSTVSQQRGLWITRDAGNTGEANFERRRQVSLSGQRQIEHWTVAAGVSFGGVAFQDNDVARNSDGSVNEFRKNMDFRTRSLWTWLEHHWGERFRIGAGLRHVTEMSRQYNQITHCESDVAVPQPGICTHLGHPLMFGQFGRVDASTPVPLLVADWHITTTQRLTASHGRGVRSSAGLLPEWIQPAERDDSTQLAWQANWWDERLQTRLALFQTRVTERFHFVETHEGARARLHGGELEISARLGERWQLNAGVGRLASYYENGYFQRRNLPGAPRQTVVLGLRYGNAQGWYGTATAYHASAAESGTAADPRDQRPAYSLLDGRLGYRSTQWDTSLIVTNAQNTRYIDRIDYPGNSNRQMPTRYRLGEPRRVELRWQYQWQ